MICRYPGCTGKAHGYGLCDKHHRRVFDGRPLDDRWYRYERQPATCTVDGCPDPTFCRGWCKRHYQRWYVHGDPLAGGPIRKRRW